MELVIFGALALAVIYVLYRTYGPKKETPTVNVVEVAAQAETVEAEAKPAKKAAAKKKPTVKKATTRKPKAK